MTGIGWWTSEEVVKSVVDKWGEVKALTRVNYTHLGHTISTDKWTIKLVKKKDIVIPPVVIHAGSVRSCEEKEMWKVHYRGVVKVCYRCLKEDHLGRDCTDDPVTMEYLASQPAFEEAPAVQNDGDATGERRTFAQIVKDASFVETRVARQKALEEKRQEMEQKREEAKQRKEKEQEARRIEKEMKERERRENGESPERGRGFSIERTSKDWSEEGGETGLGGDLKRTAGSPAFAPPDSKAVKSSSSQNRSRSRSDKGGRGPGSH